MVIGEGSATMPLGDEAVERLLTQAFEHIDVDGKRVLVIIPDSTRSAPTPLLFQLLNEHVGTRAAQLDYLVALGTHPQMAEAALDKLVGMPLAEREVRYPNTKVFNHRWDVPDALQTIGTIPASEIKEMTGGLLASDVPVTLNRSIFDYDHIVLCGPVFPHEVAGFSGGAKYLFPGIAGAEIINATHWLGALSTSMATIGVADTLVRRVIHRAAEFVPRPIDCIASVMKGHTLHGLFIGPHQEAWRAASDLSAQLNIKWLPRPVKRVLSMPSEMYDDLWTAAKAMYKTEPAIADGGEVIIYAPHISEISYTHGALIDQVGYHVRDYFVKQWEQFGHLPGGVLAHSTHVKGSGEYDAETATETQRINVTLATSIPEARCRQVNLGYVDYHTIDPQTWGAGDEDALVVPHAGEVLFRVRAE